ncbi:mitochondrial 54S ribosomal protein YmL33 [Peziza echinospora]|nr:mitochondrial 54S ribosomal protein YmL33 [Peziza echinospora]
MAFFKVTLIRSGIGMPKRINGILAALGLRKRMRTVYHPVSPDIAGMIMKVKELVAVSEVEHKLTQREQHALRTPPKGYYVEVPASQAGRI